MIIEYHRPETLEAALILMARPQPMTLPLGGGTVLNRPTLGSFAVVDLQALGLKTLEQQKNSLHIGAMFTLQALSDVSGIQPALREALQSEATYNLRQAATIAGTLVSARGYSPLVTAMLALDASLEIKGISSGTRNMTLGDLLPLRKELLQGCLITKVIIPSNAHLAYEAIARTPADLPIVCAALAQWPSGRTRLALGGFGDAPMLVLDGPEAGGVESAARDAYLHAGDEWASSEYRSEMAAVLAGRNLVKIKETYDT